MRKDAVFVNAVCKAEEMKLLSHEALLRLSAADFDDAVKMLHDYGYSEGILSENSFDIDSFMGRQVSLLIDFIREYAPSLAVEEFIIAPFLFNNIKAEYKRKMGGATSKLYNVDVGDIAKGDYGLIDENIRKVLNWLDENEVNAQVIDRELTKAQYKYKLIKAKESGSRLLTHYAKAEIDVVNILTSLRGKKLNLQKEQLSELYIEGGMFSQPFEGDLPKEYENFDLSDLVKFETQADNYLLSIADSSSQNMDSVGPLLSYVLQKMSEFKTVKMILVCIKSNARDEIAKRIRGLS